LCCPGKVVRGADIEPAREVAEGGLRGGWTGGLSPTGGFSLWRRPS